MLRISVSIFIAFQLENLLLISTTLSEPLTGQSEQSDLSPDRTILKLFQLAFLN